jgi:hypothetical protein
VCIGDRYRIGEAEFEVPGHLLPRRLATRRTPATRPARLPPPSRLLPAGDHRRSCPGG